MVTIHLTFAEKFNLIDFFFGFAVAIDYCRKKANMIITFINEHLFQLINFFKEK